MRNAIAKPVRLLLYGFVGAVFSFSVPAFAETAASEALPVEQLRAFVEVFGRYNWVDGLTIGNSKSHVDVDASSFSAGVGFGVNL